MKRKFMNYGERKRNNFDSFNKIDKTDNFGRKLIDMDWFDNKWTDVHYLKRDWFDKNWIHKSKFDRD